MERFELARELVLEAGETLRRSRLEETSVAIKTDHRDLVTRWDKETEQFLRGNLMAAFPEDRIMGEEFPGTGGCGEFVWYLDPIDGTTNFVSQRRNYAISIGCYAGGAPLLSLVLDVERQALYTARAGQGAYCNGVRLHTAGRTRVEEMLLTTSGVLRTFLRDHPWREGLLRLAEDARGVRSLGSVALELCQVAAGEADIFVGMRSCPWDHNGARLILTEAGGAACTLEGAPLPVDCDSTTVLACGCREALAMIRREYLG